MIDIRLAWDRPARPPDRRTQHVLAIGLTPQAGASQLPANLCILLDCSGSMEGAKLDQARRACRVAWDTLAKNDLLSLVTYNSRPTVRFTPSHQEDLSPELLDQHLSALRAEGLTRTELGIESAAEILTPHVGPDRASVLILITDGHPTSDDGHNRPASDYRVFYDQIEELASQGITTVTVGLGSARHYNSHFLTELADHGRGRFCYAPDAQSLAELLCDQIHLTQSMVVRGLEVTLKPRSAGVKLTDFCRIAHQYMPIAVPHADSDGAWRMTAGVLESPASNPETVFLGRVDVEGVFGSPIGQQPIATVSASWLAADGSRRATDQTVAYLDYTAIPSEQHRLVAEVDELRLRWDMICCEHEASHTDSPTRATLMLTNVAEGAGRLGLASLQEQAQEQIRQLRSEGTIDPDTITRTQQLLRATGGASVPLGLGFGGGALPAATQSPQQETRPLSMDKCSLDVIQGRSPGETLALNKSRLIIGRRENDAAIDLDLSAQDSTDSPSVSRRHAELVWDGGVLWLRDLGSANGTFVNGERLPSVDTGSSGPRRALQPGDKVALGCVVVQVACQP